MSRPMAESSQHRRTRRQFDDEFKAQAVRLVLDEGKSVGTVARDLDLTESALRNWVERARADRTHGKTGLTTAERDELARLRKENRILREEREILKRRQPSSRTSGGEVWLHRGGEGAPPARAVVSLSAGDAQRVLCLARSPRIDAGDAGPSVENADSRVVCRQQGPVWQPADSPRPA